MGNGLYRINWPGIHFDRRTEVHPTVLRDVTTTASDSEAHAVEHAEVGERSGPNCYSIPHHNDNIIHHIIVHA